MHEQVMELCISRGVNRFKSVGRQCHSRL